MSGDEKAAQIGHAVSEYQTAKVELAHIKKKIDDIFRAYRQIGETMASSRGSGNEPRFVNGKLQFGWRPDMPESALLLNIAELSDVVRERDIVQTRFDAAQKALQDLGITGIQ
ncbi:MAG: hypothetical protein WA399_14165 [Acidobacteriaceae bacterium]